MYMYMYMYTYIIYIYIYRVNPLICYLPPTRTTHTLTHPHSMFISGSSCSFTSALLLIYPSF